MFGEPRYCVLADDGQFRPATEEEWDLWRQTCRRSPAFRALSKRNPLFAIWLKYQESIFSRLGRSPSDMDVYIKRHMRRFRIRQHVVTRFAFAIPSDAALATIAKYAPIVQIGAGTGYWAHLLQRDHGVDILAYDNAPPRTGKNQYWFTREYVPIRRGSAKTAAKHPDRALLLCWPPMSSMAADCMRHYKGDTAIYIGEGSGGCTADTDFFKALARGWEEIDEASIPQWDGIHDQMSVWRRKKRVRD